MLEEIQALYRDYEAEFFRLEKNRRVGEGAFGLRGGPRDYPCHQQFARDLERLLKEAEGFPDETEQILAHVFFAPLHRREGRDAVYWMLAAVHGLAEGLIPLLDSAAARRLLTRYEGAYPRRDRLPAQKKIVNALKKRG